VLQASDEAADQYAEQNSLNMGDLVPRLAPNKNPDNRQWTHEKQS
jgi:hypothetical protein